MNKEIKFRALDKNENWIFWSIQNGDNGFWEKVRNREHKHVGQYTDLKDKNDNEIYEGDLLESIENGRIYLIKKLDSWTRFAQYDIVETIGQRDKDGSILRSNGISEDFSDDCISNPDLYEVIGNIYENPDLLQK